MGFLNLSDDRWREANLQCDDLLIDRRNCETLSEAGSPYSSSNSSVADYTSEQERYTSSRPGHISTDS